MDQYAELAQRLKPHIVKWKLQTSTTNIVTTTTTPTSMAWSSINFAGSSLSDISNRSHSLLANLLNDDHTQYVRQVGRFGIALVDAGLRVRYPTDTRYRSDISVSSGGTLFTSYDDTGAVYLPTYLDASVINLRPSGNTALGLSIASTGAVTAAPTTATQHVFGVAAIGEMAHGASWAGFAHSSMATADNFGLLHSNVGQIIVNSAAGQSISLRRANADLLTLDTNSIWYSGVTTLNTDNYISQLTGMHLGYDGSIDCRYLFTDQLHAKAFIADLEQALAGGQIISKSVTILHTDFSAPYPTIGGALTVKDLPSAHGMQVFQVADFVRLRSFSRSGGGLDISDCWGQVYSPVDNTDGTQTWNFIRSGTATYTTSAFVATQSQSSSSFASSTVTKPTGTSSGHTMIASVAYSGSPTVTSPSGWILILSQPATGVTLNIYYKVAGGSEPASYTWSFSSAINVSSTICTYSGVGYNGIWIDASNSQANTSTTSMSAPTVTPRSAAGMLVFCAATINVRATPPSGMTERADTGVTAVGSYMADVLLASGVVTGTKTATLASSSNSAAAQILLLPPVASLSTEAGAMIPTSIIEKDAIVLDYGVSGNGYAEVNAIDGIYGANSPYYQIVTWTTHPTNVTLRMRLGNLSGVTDSVFGSFSGVYGLYTSNGYFKGKAAFGNNSNIILDSNGATIALNNDLTWGVSGSIATYKTVSIDSYQSYSFKDSSTYVAGLGAGKGANKDTLILYNQQHNVDKESSVVIDSRFSSTGAGPTYDRPARLTLATSRWFPDLGVQHYASLEILSDAGNVDKITLTADSFYLNAIPFTANSGTLAFTANTNITGTLSASAGVGATSGIFSTSSTSTDVLVVNVPSSTNAYAQLWNYNNTTRANMLLQSNGTYLQLLSYDAGNTVAAPQVRIGRNSNGTVSSAGSLVLTARDGVLVYYWTDGSGNLRLSTSAAPTSLASDTTGTVVGSQVSWIKRKENIKELTSGKELLQNVLATKLYRYQMIDDGRRNYDDSRPVYHGLIITEDDRKNNAWFAENLGTEQVPALNEKNLFGSLVASIQELHAESQELRAEVKELRTKLTESHD